MNFMPLPSYYKYTTVIALLAPKLLSAQSVSGVVIDKASKQPVVNANLSSRYGLIFTSATGWFVLNKAYPGDTLYVTYVGYQPARLKVGTKRITDTIFLEKIPMLKEVAIHAQRNFKLDSINTRKEFAKVFAYKAPALKDIIIAKSPYDNSIKPNSTAEIAHIDLLTVFSLLTKKSNSTSHLQKNLLKDEENNYVDQQFSRQKVESITSLKGDSLQIFMDKYRPPIATVKKMTAYDMIVYIKKSYAEFRENNIAKAP